MYKGPMNKAKGGVGRIEGGKEGCVGWGKSSSGEIKMTILEQQK